MNPKLDPKGSLSHPCPRAKIILGQKRTSPPASGLFTNAHAITVRGRLASAAASCGTLSCVGQGIVGLSESIEVRFRCFWHCRRLGGSVHWNELPARITKSNLNAATQGNIAMSAHSRGNKESVDAKAHIAIACSRLLQAILCWRIHWARYRYPLSHSPFPVCPEVVPARAPPALLGFNTKGNSFYVSLSVTSLPNRLKNSLIPCKRHSPPQFALMVLAPLRRAHSGGARCCRLTLVRAY